MLEISDIPVIDLFAGPGGLGEGFSAVFNRKEKRVFDIKLSIEMNKEAHKTLELRSFFRQFPKNDVPVEYFELLQEPSLKEKAKLKIKLFDKYPRESSIAREEAWCAELGCHKFPSNVVDSRISKALNGAKKWALIGGPPCQAYSLVGRSRRQLKNNLDSTDPRVHLYKEYLRIIAVHHPSIFVMENVKGLLSAKLEGQKIFPLIKEDLSNPSTLFPNLNSPKYKIYSLTTGPDRYNEDGMPKYEKDTDYLIRSEEYGIPQKRHRVILLGIREDIPAPEHLLVKKDFVPLSSVIGNLPKIRSGITRRFTHFTMEPDKEGKLKKRRHYEKVNDCFEEWSRYIGEFNNQINNVLTDEEDPLKHPITLGSEYIPVDNHDLEDKHPLKDWYSDDNLGGILHHISRKHLLQDIKRYLFASRYVEQHGKFPRLEDYKLAGEDLMPDHENAESGKFTDRFRVQLPDIPATTVTSHISKDGHYFIHYDPQQSRSFTVREAARVQTFPDNYYFWGGRTQQFHQVGNAVPPYLAYQIAQVVAKIFDLLPIINNEAVEEI